MLLNAALVGPSPPYPHLSPHKMVLLITSILFPRPVTDISTRNLGSGLTPLPGSWLLVLHSGFSTNLSHSKKTFTIHMLL